MKAMFLVRIMIIIYLFGLCIMIAHAISELFFSEQEIKSRIKIFFKKILFAPFYPLSLLSKQGREVFINKIKNF